MIWSRSHDRRWDGLRRAPARLAIVQWNGEIGGAEVLSLELARAFHQRGVSSEFVFVTAGGSLAERVAHAGIPYHVLGYGHGRDIVCHPRRYSAAVAASGPDGALLPECGFIGAALRGGGFPAPIVAVEHGTLLQRPRSAGRMAMRHINRIVGAWADDLEIGVSDFIVARMRQGPHARRFGRIHNGVDTARFAPVPAPPPAAGDDAGVAGFAGRLILGKGADDAIAAVARALERAPWRLLIAGDGPDRERLSALARRLGVADRVEFLGMVAEVSRLWERCHVAIFPSNQFIESFGMVALEAMACARAVIATRNGAATELVLDGETGMVVAPGDIDALASALVAYGDRPELALAHGAAGRARARRRFHIDQCAEAYLRCFGLADDQGATTPISPARRVASRA